MSKTHIIVLKNYLKQMLKNKMNIWGENTCNIFNKTLVAMNQWEKDNNPN